MATQNTPAAKQEATPAVKAPEMAYVRAVHGKMLNLFTNVWLTSDPKKVELDDFVRGQIDAKKLEIVPA